MCYIFYTHQHVNSGSNTRWIPPHRLTYKVNFDGAIFKELGAAGLGMVIRDSEGLVIGALAERILLPCSVAMVEALACRRAVLFPKEMCIFEATVEGDAEIVISALKEGSTSNSEFGHIIQDSLVLANDLRLCAFSHVKRLGNIVAHYLARKAKSGNELQVWIESTRPRVSRLFVVFSSFSMKLTFGSGFSKKKNSSRIKKSFQLQIIKHYSFWVT